MDSIATVAQYIPSNLNSEGVPSGPILPAGPDGTRTPFRLLECDAPGGRTVSEIPDEDHALSFLSGQYPGHHLSSLSFPANMDPAMLYPEESSVYTTNDGNEYDVSCFTPGS